MWQAPKGLADNLLLFFFWGGGGGLPTSIHRMLDQWQFMHVGPKGFFISPWEVVNINCHLNHGLHIVLEQQEAGYWAGMAESYYTRGLCKETLLSSEHKGGKSSSRKGQGGHSFL